MATFRAYAKVLEPDDPTMRIYEAGLRTCPGEPGMPLAEVLRRSGGVYQTTTPLIPHMRDDIREVAELTSDAELLVIAEMTEVPVSLEHLRGLDPQTRIVIRSELSRSRSVENRPGIPRTWSKWLCVNSSRFNLRNPAPLRSSWRCVPSPQSTITR